jgi:hypothetical protein
LKLKTENMPIGTGGQYKPNVNQQSCFDKVKIGFGMGFAIGMSTGFLFGGFQAFRLGHRGSHLVKTIATSMGQAGFSFGVFMSVGSALRC